MNFTKSLQALFSFFKSFTVFTAFVFGLASYPIYLGFGYELMMGCVYNLILMYVLTLLSFWLITFSMKDKEMNLMGGLAGSMVLKMIIIMIYLFAILKKYKGEELSFTLSLMITYFLLTAFEVWFLLKEVRKKVEGR